MSVLVEEDDCLCKLIAIKVGECRYNKIKYGVGVGVDVSDDLG